MDAEVWFRETDVVKREETCQVLLVTGPHDSVSASPCKGRNILIGSDVMTYEIM
jgi:hypothetical protein